MKMLVIESSPHKQGSSNQLADNSIAGARENGHEVTVFDAGHADIHPCKGCDYCGMAGSCCQIDDMAGLKKEILGSDMIVFVTPLYYFGMSAQLKTVIDRFYSFNGQLTSKHLKSVLIAAAWDANDWTMADLKSHYLTLCRYLNFDDCGMILGTGCGTVSMTKRSGFPEKSLALGKMI